MKIEEILALITVSLCVIFIFYILPWFLERVVIKMKVKKSFFVYKGRKVKLTREYYISDNKLYHEIITNISSNCILGNGVFSMEEVIKITEETTKKELIKHLSKGKKETIIKVKEMLNKEFKQQEIKKRAKIELKGLI